jgi:hypothetical protein
MVGLVPRGEKLVSGAEIVEEWRGKRVRVLLATEGHLEGEVMRADAVGVMLALEKLAPGGEVEFTAGEGSTPMFGFVPWSQIEIVVPFPGELP